MSHFIIYLITTIKRKIKRQLLHLSYKNPADTLVPGYSKCTVLHIHNTAGHMDMGHPAVGRMIYRLYMRYLHDRLVVLV